MSNSNNGSTLGILNNVETKKILVNVFQIAQSENEADYLSQGSDILTAAEKIQESKIANVLLPLMGGVKPVRNVLIEARDGAVKSKEGLLNEAIVRLANEMITEPLFIRPRDGEVIGFDQVNAYSRAQGESVATYVNRAFYLNLVDGVKTGISYKQGTTGGAAVKGKITNASTILALPEATADNIKDKSIAFANLLRKERREIKNIKDTFIQKKFANKNIVFVISTEYEELLENDSRYNLRTELAQGEQPLTTRVEDGSLDGSPVLYSKQLPDGVAYIVLVFGAATSLFALRKTMNLDKVGGVNAFKQSIEFDEGTGVWLPQFITIGSADDAKHAAQDRKTFDALVLGIETSKTIAGGTNAGLDQAGTFNTDESIDKPNANSDIKVIKAWLDLKGIDYTGKTTKAELLALVV